jgi:hypothetical protein
MRTVSYLVMMIACLSGTGVAADNQPMDSLAMRISAVDHSGTLTLVVTNNSKAPIRIWKESNSWGVAHWRVLLIRGEQLYVFFQNPDQLFTKNNPQYREVAAGESLEQTLNLNGGNWCGLGYCGGYNDRGFGNKKANFQAGDTLVVVYDVPRSAESGKLGVWHGVVAGFIKVQ